MKLNQIMESVTSDDNTYGDKLKAKYRSDAKAISKVLFKECGPWLSRYGFRFILNRASKSVSKDEPYSIRPVRQDRRPLTTAPFIQELLIKQIDDAAEANDVAPGYANRNNSAFCYVNRPGGADFVYGKGFVYFPIGEFRTTYLLGIEDIFVDMGIPLRNLSMDLKSRTADGASAEEIKRLRDKATTEFNSINQADVVFDDISDIGKEEVMVRSESGLYIPQFIFNEPIVHSILMSKLR